MSAPLPTASAPVIDDVPCPHCRTQAVTVVLDWLDGHPWPISRRTYRCPAGHEWTHESDGG